MTNAGITYKFFKFGIFVLFIFHGWNGFSQKSVGDWKKKLKEGSSTLEQKNALVKLAVLYCDIDLDSALFWTDSLKRMIKDESNPEITAKLYSVYGFVYERRGNYSLALENQKKSLKYSLRTNDPVLISNSYNGVGVMYDFQGDYKNALKNYFKGYEIREKEGLKEGMQQSLSNIGLVYHLMGDFKNALTYLYKSRDLAEDLKDTPGYTSSLINIALVFQQQKSYDKALELYEEALQLYLKTNSKFDIALAYNNIGSVYYDMGQLQKSLFYHFKSMSIKKEIGDFQGLVMSMQNLGLVFKDLNQLDSSVFYLMQGKAILDTLPDPVGEIELSNTLGSVYLKSNDLTKAQEWLLNALRIYNDGTNYYKIYQAYENLSRLYARKGDFKKAYEYNNRYWMMQDSIQNNENAKIIQIKEIEAENKVRQREEKLKKDAEEKQREMEKKAEEKQQRIWNIFYACIFGVLLIVIFFIYRGYNEKKKANGLLSERNNIISIQNVEIRKQSELLEEKNRDITDSIQYAKRLQDAILPTDSEMTLALKDYFVLYRPKDIVSGDFYWMHDLSSGNQRKYLFAVVDCTGHGVPGGFVSIVGNNALNRAVNEFGLTKPNLILDKISELVENSFESENTEIRDGMDIALISVTYSDNKVLVEFSGANNPLWYISSNKPEQLEIMETKADKQPIGKYEARKPFSLHTMHLAPGDRIYLFSDGYADQFGGNNGKKFKYSQLKEKLIAFSGMPMEKQKSELEKIILNWKGELEQIDDICIAGINL